MDEHGFLTGKNVVQRTQRERLAALGADALSHAELIAILLRTGLTAVTVAGRWRGDAGAVFDLAPIVGGGGRASRQRWDERVGVKRRRYTT